MSTLANEVKRLSGIYASIQRDKDRERELQLAMAPKREIVDAPSRHYQPYWCICCGRDYHATGNKVVEGQGASMSAVYKSQCPEGHDNYRYITDVGNDPYFNRSQDVAKDRALHADDILSPHDSRFQTVYRQQWLQHEARREQLHGK